MGCDKVGATHKYNYMYMYRTIHNMGWGSWGYFKIKKIQLFIRKQRQYFVKKNLINTNSTGSHSNN